MVPIRPANGQGLGPKTIGKQQDGPVIPMVQDAGIKKASSGNPQGPLKNGTTWMASSDAFSSVIIPDASENASGSEATAQNNSQLIGMRLIPFQRHLAARAAGPPQSQRNVCFIFADHAAGCRWEVRFP